MPVRARSTAWAYAAALSWRSITQRFGFVLLMALAASLLILGHRQPVMVEKVRSQVMDGLAPVLDALGRPVAFAEDTAATVASYFSLRGDNLQLRAENEQLRRWQNVALALENENKELRDLLHYNPEPNLTYISARVIAEAGGAFARTLLVTAGRDNGVRVGMAAMTGDGLIGRVVEVGAWSSRVLLITDVNSRIPVTLSGSGDHAILAGDNSFDPYLLYLPHDAAVKPGMRVMTSGQGGVFPPNVPVAVVGEVKGDLVTAVPLANIGRINQVRLVDFNLAGGSFNAMGPKGRTSSDAPCCDQT